MPAGFAYLVAILDVFSRRVLAWRLSNTLDARFCIEALREALTLFGKPEVFNTDQGSQFTSGDFVRALEVAGVKISMDGRGRWIDNVFIERGLAEREVRGHLPACVRGSRHRTSGDWEVRGVLQWEASAFESRSEHPECRVRWRRPRDDSRRLPRSIGCPHDGERRLSTPKQGRATVQDNGSRAMIHRRVCTPRSISVVWVSGMTSMVDDVSCGASAWCCRAVGISSCS